jgi:tRNA pseudouridine55 synthase
MSPGLHLVHKPEGATSFSLVQAAIEAVARVRTHARPRVCHGGALDPFASGLMLILVGPATRLFDHLHAIPKTYEATVRWGVETSTGDPGGAPTLEGNPSSLTAERLDSALAGFVGWSEQVPPSTSNKRIDGERAYVRVHRGERVTLPPSRVYLHEARWLSHELPRQSRVRLIARGGYYVRALARDLGRLLDCGAHLTALHRAAIGPWQDPGSGHAAERHGGDLLPWAAARNLSDLEVGELRQQRSIPCGQVLPPEWALPDGFPDPAAPIRGLHRGRLVFLLKAADDRLHGLTAFRGGL